MRARGAAGIRGAGPGERLRRPALFPPGQVLGRLAQPSASPWAGQKSRAARGSTRRADPRVVLLPQECGPCLAEEEVAPSFLAASRVACILPGWFGPEHEKMHGGPLWLVHKCPCHFRI